MKRLSTVFKRKSSQQVPQGSASATKSDASQPAPSTTTTTTTTAGKDAPKAKGPFLGAIDQGTTSSRFLIFDTAGVIIAQHQLEFNQYHKHSG